MKQDAEFETLLGYQIQRANLLMIGDARKALEPSGLTPAKLTALMLIRANPGCDQTALGRALSINRSSAMKLTNALVASDLIERRPGRDLRTNALHLLPQGEAELVEMLARLHESDRHMTGRLTDAERTTLSGLLRKLGPSRRKAGTEPG